MKRMSRQRLASIRLRGGLSSFGPAPFGVSVFSAVLLAACRRGGTDGSQASRMSDPGGGRFQQRGARLPMNCRVQGGACWRTAARHRRAAGVLGCLALAGLVLAACGSGTASTAPTVRSKPTSSSSTLTSAPATTDQASAAVLAAYRAGWAAFEQALASANPEDPALAATMLDPQLQSVKANLLADQRQGVVGRGTTALHPKIAAISASTATVVDCVYSTAALVYKTTGKPVPPVTPPENDGVRATLTLVGGAWKVSKQTVTDGSCAPGS